MCVLNPPLPLNQCWYQCNFSCKRFVIWQIELPKANDSSLVDIQHWFRGKRGISRQNQKFSIYFDDDCLSFGKVPNLFFHDNNHLLCLEMHLWICFTCRNGCLCANIGLHSSSPTVHRVDDVIGMVCSLYIANFAEICLWWCDYLLLSVTPLCVMSDLESKR